MHERYKKPSRQVTASTARKARQAGLKLDEYRAAVLLSNQMIQASAVPLKAMYEKFGPDRGVQIAMFAALVITEINQKAGELPPEGGRHA